MDKLSELSKPVGYFIEWQDEETGEKEWCECSKQNGAPLYSQEYVSALLAELEARDGRIGELSRLLAHNIERAEKAEKRLVYSKDAIATWERKAISNFDECATMSQRIIELEAIRSDSSQVFKEIGNELGCNPDNESIMMAIDDLKKRLATPVRLTEERTLWAGEDDYDTGHVKGWNANRIEQAALLKKQGFTVEGDA